MNITVPDVDFYLPKQHTKRESKTLGFTEPDKSIHDSGSYNSSYTFQIGDIQTNKQLISFKITVYSKEFKDLLLFVSNC